MKVTTLFISLFFLLLQSECVKYEMDEKREMPKSISIGESILLVDGKRFDVLSRCQRYLNAPTILYHFIAIKPYCDFSVELLNGIESGRVKKTFFFNQVRGDRDVNQFEVIRDGSQIFEITSVDTVSMVVQGWFEFKVKRTNVRVENPETRTHKEFWVQGVFHEQYTLN